MLQKEPFIEYFVSRDKSLVGALILKRRTFLWNVPEICTVMPNVRARNFIAHFPNNFLLVKMLPMQKQNSIFCYGAEKEMIGI